MTKLTPIHPGEILHEEFLGPLSLSQYRLAKETGVPARRINEIVLQKRGISADTALRLARYFGTSELFWLNLQARYELDIERARLGSQLTDVRPYVPPTPVSLPARPKVAVAQRATMRRSPRTVTDTHEKRGALEPRAK